MRSNTGMANTGGRRLALHTSLRPNLALWLGLVWLGLESKHNTAGCPTCRLWPIYRLHYPGSYNDRQLTE